MCPWLGLGLTLTRTRTLTARRQGRAQSAPAARKKKQPVRHARSTETGIVSPRSRLYLGYIFPISPQVSSTEDGAFRLRAEGHAAGGGAEGATAKTGGGRAARRRAALRRSSKGGADEGGDDDEPARKPRKAPQAAQVQKRQRAVSAQQADKIRKLSGR